jgi:hypothetical protein
MLRWEDNINMKLKIYGTIMWTGFISARIRTITLYDLKRTLSTGNLSIDPFLYIKSWYQ